MNDKKDLPDKFYDVMSAIVKYIDETDSKLSEAGRAEKHAPLAYATEEERYEN